MAFAGFILGPIVGTATYSGPSSLNSYVDFTLTGDVAATTPGFYRGIAYAIASSQPDAGAPLGFTTPAEYNARAASELTSLDHDDYTGAYSEYKALEPTANILPLSDSIRSYVGHSYVQTGGTTHMFRGMFTSIAYQDFSIGDQMRFRIDLTDFGTSLDWWKVNFHSCEYPSFWSSTNAGLLSSGTGSTIAWNPSLFGNVWRGFVCSCLTSLDTTLLVTSRVLPTVFSDTYDGIITRPGTFRSVYSGHDMWPSTNTGGTLTITKNVTTNASYFLGYYLDAYGLAGPNYAGLLSLNYHH